VGSPFPFSYLAALIGLNSLVFVVFALLRPYESVRDRLAIGAATLTALGAFLGSLIMPSPICAPR